MTLSELKNLISNKELPKAMVWVDCNHEFVNYYLDQTSLIYNRKIKKFFDTEEAIEGITSDFIENLNIIYIKKDFDKLADLLSTHQLIFLVDEDVETKLPKVYFNKVSRNANISYIENYLSLLEKSIKGAKLENGFISRELLEKALDYFEDDLDKVMNEIHKVEVLELTSNWDKPFGALLNCLPKKDLRLRSLKWFSGGDVDTCQVLYNIYMKKLKGLSNSSPDEQKIWAKLVREAIWCEACILSGTIGDYVSEYLQLVENSLPSDFKVEYFPPVFYSEVIDHPEYKVNQKVEEK